MFIKLNVSPEHELLWQRPFLDEVLENDSDHSLNTIILLSAQTQLTSYATKPARFQEMYKARAGEGLGGLRAHAVNVAYFYGACRAFC